MTCRAWTLKEFDRTALKELTSAIAEQNTEELEQNALDDEPGASRNTPPRWRHNRRKRACWRASWLRAASPTPLRR